MVNWDSLTPDQKKRWAERQIKKLVKMASDQKEAKERKLEIENSPKRRDTKPVLYLHEEADRPIIVVGSRSQFLEDLKDIARRRAEEPFLRNPDKFKRPHPMDTLRTILDMKQREKKGIKVFGPNGSNIINKEGNDNG